MEQLRRPLAGGRQGARRVAHVLAGELPLQLVPLPVGINGRYGRRSR